MLKHLTAENASAELKKYQKLSREMDKVSDQYKVVTGEYL